MCIAIPGKIVEIREEERGMVDLGGVCKEVSLTFLPKAKVGDWIIIHTGFGLEIMSEEDALETISLLRQAYSKQTD